MKKISWADRAFGDVGWREANAINQAADELQGLHTANSGLATQIGKLLELDRIQAAEIEGLRLTVRVLSEVLIDTLGLDEKILEYRLQAAMEEAQAVRAETLAKGPQVSCSSCANEVPNSQTHITEHGVVCDACHQG